MLRFFSLAILIDDSLDQEVASQWNDLKAFIDAQPQSTLVAVAYSRNGTAAVAQDFTNDHALAAKALRIPLGTGGSSAARLLDPDGVVRRMHGAGLGEPDRWIEWVYNSLIKNQ